ncbi:hypothetical protein CYMTET_27056, partial [Cymbomonas tetramitiformis]
MATKEDQEVKPLAEDDVWNYEKINRIGEGTYGVVYRARHKPTNEIVALKKVRMDRERDGVPVTAVRELRILQSIDHPNIVKLKKVVTGNKKDSIFLVFEYCEHDLARLVDTMRTPFSEAESKSLFLQLLQAVEFLHRHRIVHRDLKLSNLLFNNRGQLKLCDFGLARYFQVPARPCPSHCEQRPPILGMDGSRRVTDRRSAPQRHIVVPLRECNLGVAGVAPGNPSAWKCCNLGVA